MKSSILDNQHQLTEYRDRANEPIIMVMGVGGGGGNIVTQMYQQADFDGVSFVLCNTDKQDLYDKHKAERTIQLGPSGLGAGADMSLGRKCAEHPKTTEEIRATLSADSLRMLFVVATLGGGTGTGASPVIARIAKEIEKPTDDPEQTESLLVVGVVTLPNKSEGEGDVKVALSGLKELMKHTDAVIIIHNEGTLKAVDPDQPCSEADEELNKIPIQAVKAISWIINQGMKQNVDFNDIKNILKGGESALISIGYGSGKDRMKQAIEEATYSPFLNNRDLFKAKRLMYCIFDNSEKYGKEVELKAGERDQIIPNEFLSRFQNIESDSKSNKKRIIRGINTSFPAFEEKFITEKDTIGLIVLATGFMFQKEEYYEPSDWGDEIEEEDNEIDLTKEFYESNSANDKAIINLSPALFGLPAHLIDNESCIHFLEKQSPGLRDSESLEEYKELTKKQSSNSPLNSNLNH